MTLPATQPDHAAPPGAAPFFSVIIPMFNRAPLMRRTIGSCLQQDFSGFEVVVVDDGSTDGSVDVVRSIDDPRVRLICLERNSGQNTARNRGVRESRGEWLVFLDSDDELAPGALSAIHRRILDHGHEVDKILLTCQLSGGGTSPNPPFPDEVWDYERFLAWMESKYGQQTECMPCTRRSAFVRIPYSEGHALEAIHELDFIRQHRVFVSSDRARIYHDDAGNNSRVMSSRRFLQIARAFARDLDDIVARHGDALERLAPRVGRELLGMAALYSFGAGHRLRGVRHSLAYLRRRPTSLSGWAAVPFGLLGARPLAWLHETAHRLARGRPLRPTDTAA